MTALLILTIMLAAWGALPITGDDAAHEGRSLSQQTAGCGLAVALAIFVGGLVFA